MINRELIRIKEIQTVYSFYQNESMGASVAEKELLKSISYSYDLYKSLLLLLLEINRVAEQMLDIRETRARRLNDEQTFSQKFVNNRFILQLASNKQLLSFAQEMRFHWADYEDFVRGLYTRVEVSDFYQEYMQQENSSYADDREVWRRIYRSFICNNEELDAILEDISIYWNDDKCIVDTFVLKTINRFREDSDADQPLLPEYKDEADQEFAVRLLHHALSNASYYHSLIASTTRRWELERIALMDRVILQVALAEILSFPTIPVNVSINEYLEIAKMYGGPASPRYINATLDSIVKKLHSENKLVKEA